jgi:hypothetical protein
MGRDETSRDYTAGIVTTTSVTATLGRPPRKFYFWIQVLAFGLTVAVAFLAGRVEEEALRTNLQLPVSSEVLVKLGRVLREPLGLSCVAAIILGLGLLALKGVLDGILKALIWLNVLWIVAVCAIYFMGGIAPFRDLAERLK